MHYTVPMEKPFQQGFAQFDLPMTLLNERSIFAMDEHNNTSEPDSDDLNAWIARAKRAHELVDAVDLNKVAAHDDIELNKLSAVNNALGDLSSGGHINHVEGVDEVIRELTPEEQQKAELLTVLTQAGWGSRIGRTLWLNNGADDLRPLELIPHREGLPEFETCVAPEQAVGNGYFALFISSHGIFGASIGEPPSKHHWHISRSRPYDNHAELLKCIEQFSRTAFE